MSYLESKIDIPNLFEFESLASLKSAIEFHFKISITKIYIIQEQGEESYFHLCQTEQDYSQYISLKQQSIDQIGYFYYYYSQLPPQNFENYSKLPPQDFEILSISGTPDLVSVNSNTLINKTWILKSKTKFNLFCVEGEFKDYFIEPSTINDDVYQFDFSFNAEGSARLVMLYFKAKGVDDSFFGPMLWVSVVIL